MRTGNSGKKEVKISDIYGERTLEIDAHSETMPDSVFLIDGDHCIEFDRATFIKTFMKELGLWEPVHYSVSRYLASVTAA